MLIGLLAVLVFASSVTAQGNAPAVPVVSIAVDEPYDGFGFAISNGDENVVVIRRLRGHVGGSGRNSGRRRTPERRRKLAVWLVGRRYICRPSRCRLAG